MPKIKCSICAKIIESKHVHDCVYCNCSNQTSIDGGNEYTRIGGKDLSKILVLKNGKWKQLDFS